MTKDENGLKRLNKWLGLIISVIAIFSMLIGTIAGMVIKSAKIDEAYECAKENERAIHDSREIMIRIDENMKFVRKEIEDMK